MRVSKAPEERKQEILDMAINHFYAKGYEKTTLEDIADELGVVKGLCYRYFPSKQDLYDQSKVEYVEKRCAPLLPIIHNKELSIMQRFEQVIKIIIEQESVIGEYTAFSKIGNLNVHEQLSIKMCKQLILHFEPEVIDANLHGELHLDNPQAITEFILYGQIFIWENQNISGNEKITLMTDFVKNLLQV